MQSPDSNCTLIHLKMNTYIFLLFYLNIISFCVTDDIFADTSSKPESKKSSKKSAASSTTTSTATKPDTDIFDSPNIFDDPLSAMKS